MTLILSVVTFFMELLMTKNAIVLFAGSSLSNDPLLAETAAALGKAVATAGYELLYGAGNKGLMGLAAQSALDHGGSVTGIVMKRYADETQPAGARLLPVDSEQERFDLFRAAKPALYVALPGGPGTMREVLQAVEAAVYEGDAPVVLIKAGNYMDGLKSFFDQSVAAGLIRSEHAGALQLLDVPQAMALANKRRVPPAIRKKTAQLKR
jgi:uncharacterized protein (TIGR00730 family)